MCLFCFLAMLRGWDVSSQIRDPIWTLGIESTWKLTMFFFCFFFLTLLTIRCQSNWKHFQEEQSRKITFHQIYYYFIWYVLCGAEWTQPGFRYTNKVPLYHPCIPFNHSSPSTATLKGYIFKEGKERRCIYSSIFYIKPLWNLTVWTADSFEGWDERHSALWQECQKYLFFLHLIISK